MNELYDKGIEFDNKAENYDDGSDNEEVEIDL